MTLGLCPIRTRSQLRANHQCKHQHGRRAKKPGMTIKWLCPCDQYGHICVYLNSLPFTNIFKNMDRIMFSGTEVKIIQGRKGMGR